MEGKRRNFYVTNKEVNKILDESHNFSKLIELAILHYTESREYMTRAECIALINSYFDEFTGTVPPEPKQQQIKKSDLDEIMGL